MCNVIVITMCNEICKSLLNNHIYTYTHSVTVLLLLYYIKRNFTILNCVYIFKKLNKYMFIIIYTVIYIINIIITYKYYKYT